MMMRKSQTHRKISKVTLSLEIHPSLNRFCDRGDPLKKAICRTISGGLTELLEILGIPGRSTVRATKLREPTMGNLRLLRVSVNGQLCRYSDELLGRVYNYVTDVPLTPEVGPNEILAWLRELSGQRDEKADFTIAEFFRFACLEVIKRNPAVLLGRDQVDTYQTSLPLPSEKAGLQQGTWPPEQTWLHQVLSKVLSVRVSIADKERVVDVLTRGLEEKQSQEDIVEDLIVVLRPDIVEIQLSRDYLKEVTTAASGNGYDNFSIMRDGMFYELGLNYPDFRFTPVEYLKRNGFAFKINHLTTLPRIGLRLEQCLVNDTTDRLSLLNIQGMRAINPANASECSIIDSNYRQIAESAGLTTWNQMGYLVLSFAADLRENSACLVHRQGVQSQFDQLAQAFPTLVDTVQERVGINQVTRVLRALVAEGLSIRNLRLILEWMLDYDYIVTDPYNYIIFDDRMPTSREPDEAWLRDPVNLASFVRVGMKRYISSKYARGGNTLVVYLLDREIEESLLEHLKRGSRLAEDKRDKILEAVRGEVSTLPSTGSIPSILTTIDLRAFVREVILPEFPRLPVLAYNELSPDMNIQPIARIALT
ncbi:MAG: FHIPEP family type III secretion protein [Candidatus Hodarchaeota archaeon]